MFLRSEEWHRCSSLPVEIKIALLVTDRFYSLVWKINAIGSSQQVYTEPPQIQWGETQLPLSNDRPKSASALGLEEVEQSQTRTVLILGSKPESVHLIPRKQPLWPLKAKLSLRKSMISTDMCLGLVRKALKVRTECVLDILRSWPISVFSPGHSLLRTSVVNVGSARMH